jgi:hypothetical protein
METIKPLHPSHIFPHVNEMPAPLALLAIKPFCKVNTNGTTSKNHFLINHQQPLPFNFCFTVNQ